MLSILCQWNVWCLCWHLYFDNSPNLQIRVCCVMVWCQDVLIINNLQYHNSSQDHPPTSSNIQTRKCLIIISNSSTLDTLKFLSRPNKPICWEDKIKIISMQWHASKVTHLSYLGKSIRNSWLCRQSALCVRYLHLPSEKRRVIKD